MCSHYPALKTMENNYEAGDLADIFRPTTTTVYDDDHWQFPGNPITYSSDPLEEFGDPFTYIRDPLIPTPLSSSSSSGLFYSSNAIKPSSDHQEETGGFISGAHHHHHHDEMKRPSSNMFSRMLQISPNAKSPPCEAVVAAARPPPAMLVSHVNTNNNRMLISASTSKGCLVESPVALQISSPLNAGIKRRKSQAKKVVCIPAPAPANSRATGEVVPSDLWAWRKYGQKPIKGSPYPRGYYRCSSSKGCSARKQVERSRTDPNMLVITYTWEHNHPWPTQRNALAGSTRSQPSKNNATKKDPTTKSKESSASTAHAVKEEMADQDFMDQFDQGTYKPDLEESFFADLSEIEVGDDPLDLQGFRNDEQGRGNKDDSDPFSFYTWATSANSSSTTSCEEANCRELIMK